MYDSTKTAVFEMPKQIRTDPDLKAAVVFISNANNRSIQGQILHWVTEGVKQEQAKLSQVPSEKVIWGAGPKSVKVRNRQEKVG